MMELTVQTGSEDCMRKRIAIIVLATVLGLFAGAYVGSKEDPNNPRLLRFLNGFWIGRLLAR
jgi:hypothetical protein